MIELNQIRKFKTKQLPNIKVGTFSENKNAYLCTFEEDFYYPYITMSAEEIENETEIIYEDQRGNPNSYCYKCVNYHWGCPAVEWEEDGTPLKSDGSVPQWCHSRLESEE